MSRTALGLLSALAFAVSLACLSVAVPQEGNEKPGYDTAWLQELLGKTEWKFQYDADQKVCSITTGDRVVFCSISGKDPVYVSVRAPIPDFPAQPTPAQLHKLLERNYELYLGHYGLDPHGRLWFEINTPARLADAAQLNQVILWVHREIDRARTLLTEP